MNIAGGLCLMLNNKSSIVLANNDINTEQIEHLSMSNSYQTQCIIYDYSLFRFLENLAFREGVFTQLSFPNQK